MQTIAFLQRVLPEAPAYFLQTLLYGPDRKPVKGKGRSIKVKNLEQLDARIKQAVSEGYDVYVSMAGYAAHAKGHFAAFAQSHKAHYLDLDCGPDKPFPDQRAAIDALIVFLKQTGLPTPLIVLSGYGVHVYWPYTTALDNERWLKIAHLLRAVCDHAEFAIDGGITIDSVRLLRPIGTANLKDRNAPKPVQLAYAKQADYAPLDIGAFLTPLVSYAKQHTLSSQPQPKPAAQGYDSDLAANMPGLDPYSATQIGQEGCVAVRWFMHNGGDRLPPETFRMSQTDWMSMGRLAKFSNEGEEWFHEHGAKYAGYDRAESQGVLNRSFFRGVTCDSLVQDPTARRSICGRCPHHNKINSPLHLGTAKPPPLDEIPPEGLQQPDMEFDASEPPSDGAVIACPDAMKNRGYVYDARGVWRKPPKGPKAFVSNYFIEHIDKLSEANDTHHYMIHWRAPHGRRVAMEIGGGDMNALPQAVLRKIGDADIGFNNKESIMSYMRDWVNSISSQVSVLAATQMGWQEDGSFVIGTDCYKDGKHSRARLVGAANEEVSMYETRGTLEAQLMAIKAIFPKLAEFVPAHILIIGALAPIALIFDRIPSPTVSAYSLESGHGKSLAESALLGIWGNPVLLEMKGAKASITAVNNRLGTSGSIPLVLDEVTGSDPERVFEIVNLIQGNKTSDRAYANGSNRAAHAWRTAAYISTNEPLRHKLRQVDNTTDGVSMRLIEFEYVNTMVKQGKWQANKESLFHHYGHISRWVLERFTADMPRYQQAWDRALKFFMSLPGETQNSGGERIWHRWFASNLMMADLCINEWKLFDMDFDAIKAKLVEYLKEQRADYRVASPDDFTRLMEILWRMSRNGVRVERGKPINPGDIMKTKSGVTVNTTTGSGIVLRQEDDTGKTLVKKTVFDAEARGYEKHLIEFAKANKLCEQTTRRVRLTGYLGASEQMTTCYVFNQARLDQFAAQRNEYDTSSVVGETDDEPYVASTFEEERSGPQPHAPHLRTVK